MYGKILLAIFLTIGTVAQATEPLVIKNGIVLLKFGVVELENAGGEKKEFNKEAESGEFPEIVLRPGETLRVLENADCAVIFPQGGVVKVAEKSAIKIPVAGGPEAQATAASLELIGGKLFLDIDAKKLATQKKQFRLKTPTAILGVKGTRFFAEAGDKMDTAGVHLGEVVMVEPESGKSLIIKSGNAAMTKIGAISNLRILTAGEAAYGEIYKDFAIEFIAGERDNRKFSTSYTAQVDPKTAISTEFPKLIKAEKSAEMESGTAFKITILPLVDKPTVSIFAKTFVEIPVRPGAEPVGIMFMARGTDIRRVNLRGSLKHKDRVFQISDSTQVSFQKGTPSDEWVPFFVPLQEIFAAPELEPGSIEFSMNPNLHEGRAVESIIMVEKDKEKFILEISPILVALRPEK